MTIWRVPYPKFGAGPGLERVGAVSKRLGIDLGGFGKTGAGIVGSNGKGSTAVMTAALLDDGLNRVGLFTSPHLFDLNERFRIGDADIADDELRFHWARVERAITLERVEAKVGGFEFLFLIAADWFTARGCTHTVWEAGIGGRLDPVRLIAGQRLALTSLDFEHTELLGETLDVIARNKLDAAPRGATIFVSTSCSSERETIEAHCRDRGVHCTWVGEAAPPASLAGAHQRQNAALAVAVAQAVLGRPLSDDVRMERLTKARWPGRLEVINRAPLVVIDVGHTPAAIEAALTGFRAMTPARRGVLVCGASNDKAIEGLISRLAPQFDAIVCASALHKGAAASLIAQFATAANPKAEVTVAETMAQAHRLAMTYARRENLPVYVAGGLFLAAEFKAVHLGRDPASLAFF